MSLLKNTKILWKFVFTSQKNEERTELNMASGNSLKAKWSAAILYWHGEQIVWIVTEGNASAIFAADKERNTKQNELPFNGYNR